MRKLFLPLLALLLVTSPAALRAEDFQVAVAANFTSPATEIAAAFERETGDRPVLSFGSTGNFKTQIENGAPFAAFLSADAKTPGELEESGLAVPGTRFTYARGALVLWSATPGYVDGKGEVLRKGGFRFLAVANPDLAPYGFAGREVLERLGLLPGLESKIVTGNNITDTFQAVKTGNAELGFIAWSQVCKDGKLTEGSAYMVPADLYGPILQDAVLLKPGEGSGPARAFLEYVRDSPAAREIILSYGYELPAR
ncbi:MAG: molybdate ABC transporter substrate-binding protein [Deltaproteobacteria bacterium]|jgi:molybdate transport system substrate-binding protein|nr:molybdate ABC transporter substrate-binding protein [Deltaproteobacteria bacterium]